MVEFTRGFYAVQRSVTAENRKAQENCDLWKSDFSTVFGDVSVPSVLMKTERKHICVHALIVNRVLPGLCLFVS